MKILLIGYGKMGKAIEAIATQRGHTITGRIDEAGSNWEIPADTEVAIEFTHPESVVANLHKCFRASLPVVCGTTGWLTDRADIEKACREQNASFFYASNYSMGVNIFFKLNNYLARLMQGQTGYEVSLDETHHTQKKDAPSGTAITLAEGIIANLGQKTKWVKEAATSPEELAIRSHRVDPAPGTHVVTYHSAIDDIAITHTAHSREGFAMGAVLAAEWLPGKAGVFGMDDLLPF